MAAQPEHRQRLEKVEEADRIDRYTKLYGLLSKIGLHLLVLVLVAVIVLFPEKLPILNMFPIKTTSFNALGQTFAIVDSATLGKNVKIRNGSLFVSDIDVNDISDTFDAKNQQIKVLTDSQDRLSKTAASLRQALDQAVKQRDEANAQLADLIKTQIKVLTDSEDGLSKTAVSFQQASDQAVKQRDETSAQLADLIRKKPGFALVAASAPVKRNFDAMFNEQIKVLTDAQDGLAKTAASFRQAFDQAVKERDQANAQLADLIKKHGAALAAANAPATGNFAAILNESKDQIAQAAELLKAVADAARKTAADRAATASEEAASGGAGFALIFGSDATALEADVEADQAKNLLKGAEIAIFHRLARWRSVSLYSERSKAEAELKSFQTNWPTAYIVDMSRWCPLQKQIQSASASSAAQIDCGF